jgi:hypothetical protein
MTVTLVKHFQNSVTVTLVHVGSQFGLVCRYASLFASLFGAGLNFIPQGHDGWMDCDYQYYTGRVSSFVRSFSGDGDQYRPQEGRKEGRKEGRNATTESVMFERNGRRGEKKEADECTAGHSVSDSDSDCEWIGR